MTSILVTGGTGFVGTNLVLKAKDYGLDVFVVDDFSNSSELAIQTVFDLIGNKKLINSSFYASQIVKDLIVNNDISVVVHLAAMNSVTRSTRKPLKTIQCNTFGTAALNNTIRFCPSVQHIVIASSSSVYGDTLSNSFSALKEVDKLDPKSIYGASKYAMEVLARSFSRCYDLNISVLRLFNVFGPFQSPYVDYPAVIPIFAKQAIVGQNLTVYGDGSQKRDFTFVENVSHALIDTIYSKTQGFSLMNIACQEAHTINEVASMVLKILNSSKSIIHVAPRKEDILYSKAKIKRAKQLINYKCSVSLYDGLVTTCEWYKKNLLKFNG